MNYKIETFVNGIPKAHVKSTGDTPLDALKVAYVGSYHCAKVMDDTTVYRFGPFGTPVTDAPTFHKIYHNGTVPSILVMFGSCAEIYHFSSKSKRNEVYDICIQSLSAESVNPDPAQTDTIVSFEETSASKSGSTSNTISNGYAMSATWQDALTRENTDKSSGIDKYADTDTKSCVTGSMPYLSEPNQTFFAKIVNLPPRNTWEWPGVNNTMVGYFGKTLEFTPYPTPKKPSAKAKHYMWLMEWLSTTNVTLKVKALPEGTQVTYKKTVFNYDPRFAGKTVEVTLCPCGCGCYYTRHQEHYFHTSWLEEIDE